MNGFPVISQLRPSLLSIVCVASFLPSLCFAQSTELLQTYQRFEEAKAANDLPAALQHGRQALQSIDAGAEHSDADLIDLLASLGDAMAKAGEDAQAIETYRRAIAQQEKVLGADHPDLVANLQSLASLYLKGNRYTEALTVYERILAIEQAAYGARHGNALATLQKIRDIYKVTGDTEALTRVETKLEQLSLTDRGHLGLATAKKDRHYKQEDGFATVRVFYGTNRGRSGDAKPALFYGGARGELDFGYLDVSIPEIHQEGELETQSRWSISSISVDEAKRRFVLLNQVAPLAKDDFLDALRKQIGASSSKDVFVFVHGFNSSFEDAARRTAQLAYDLDFDGTPMMYSWPSQGSTTAYTVDEASVQISSRRMATFLEALVDQSGAGRIHLIAHSMGNRALIEALETYLAKRPTDRRKGIFGQVVFTAPDVDRDYFLETIKSFETSADRVTLYASDNDLALKTSQKIHGAPRAGLAGAGIITIPWLDTIDMSAVQADMLGHNYYAADAGAIYDLFRLLWRSEPPPQRCGMNNRPQSGVWTFNVSVCQGHDLLKAGVLFKRFGQRARARARAKLAGITDPNQKEEWSRILARLDDLLKPQNRE